MNDEPEVFGMNENANIAFQVAILAFKYDIFYLVILSLPVFLLVS